LQVPDQLNINGLLSRVIEAYGDALDRVLVEPRKVISFGQLDLHRAMPATEAGWRIFVRVSMTKLRPVRNEIRTQGSQVYVTDPNAGW